MMTQYFIPDCFWQELIRQQNTPSECHCKCGEIFFSLSHYVGKKTKTIIQKCCPSCGSWEIDYVIPQKEDRTFPALETIPFEKRKKFRRKNVVQNENRGQIQ